MEEEDWLCVEEDLLLDVILDRPSRDYVCDLKKGDVIPTCENLSNLFDYFKAICWNPPRLFRKT
jgi:hypothetical protein